MFVGHLPQWPVYDHSDKFNDVYIFNLRYIVRKDNSEQRHRDGYRPVKGCI